MVILSGSNNYTGGTTVSEGTLEVTDPGALPTTGIINVGRSGVVSLLGLLVIPGAVPDDSLVSVDTAAEPTDTLVAATDPVVSGAAPPVVVASWQRGDWGEPRRRLYGRAGAWDAGPVAGRGGRLGGCRLAAKAAGTLTYKERTPNVSGAPALPEGIAGNAVDGSAAAVPEPATGALLAAGAVASGGCGLAAEGKCVNVVGLSPE